jgi:hypothetical protein
VVAGHSGGAQVVQRYAIAGKAELALTREGVGVRYVVANPSTAERQITVIGTCQASGTTAIKC